MTAKAAPVPNVGIVGGGVIGGGWAARFLLHGSRVRVFDPSFVTKPGQTVVERKLHSHLWSAEQCPTWVLSDDECYEYKVKPLASEPSFDEALERACAGEERRSRTLKEFLQVDCSEREKEFPGHRWITDFATGDPQCNKCGLQVNLMTGEPVNGRSQPDSL